jgi:hypothetical protein
MTSRCVLAFALVLPVLAVGCPQEPILEPVDADRIRRDGGPIPDAPLPDAHRVPVCPPRGPFGTETGDQTVDATFFDCDGNPRTLHELCAHEAVWIYELAEWCGPCRTFVQEHANRIYDARRAALGERFEAWILVSEDAALGQSSAALCASVRDRYGLHMPVLFDRDAAFQTLFQVAPNEIHLVLSDEARIERVGPLSPTEVETFIDRALTR